MPDQPYQKLSAGIAALSRGDATYDVSIDDVREVMDDPNPSIQQSDLPPALIVHSLFHQIEFAVQPGRTQIIDKSADSPFKESFPRICAQALRSLEEHGVSWRAYGWNFHVSYPTDDQTGGMLIARLLSEPAKAIEKDLQGGSLALSYLLNDAVVTLKLSPVLGGTMLMKFLFLEITTLPTPIRLMNLTIY